MVAKLNRSDENFEYFFDKVFEYVTNENDMNNILKSKLIQSENLTTEMIYFLNLVDVVREKVYIQDSIYGKNILNRIKSYVKFDTIENLRKIKLNNRNDDDNFFNKILAKSSEKTSTNPLKVNKKVMKVINYNKKGVLEEEINRIKSKADFLDTMTDIMNESSSNSSAQNTSSALQSDFNDMLSEVLNQIVSSDAYENNNNNNNNPSNKVKAQEENSSKEINIMDQKEKLDLENEESVMINIQVVNKDGKVENVGNMSLKDLDKIKLKTLSEFASKVRKISDDDSKKERSTMMGTDSSTGKKSTVKDEADDDDDDDDDGKEEEERVIEIGPDFLKNFVTVALNETTSVAESTLVEYFDDRSLLQGAAISREGAGRFQADILKDLFVVSGVKLTNGAALFNGRILPNSTQVFIQKMNEKLNATGISQEVDYIFLKNDRSLTSSGKDGLLDALLGGTPALIIFPIEWKSKSMMKLNDGVRTLWRYLLSGVAAASSFGFAATCFNLLSITGPLAQEDPYLPDDFLYLAIAPIAIHNFASAAEIFVAKLKGITTSYISLPAFTLPSYGTRVAYHSLPKNRQDIFDLSAIGFFTSVVTSLITFLVGMQLTASASPEVLDSFPTIPLQLIKFNAIITQLLNFQFPNLFKSVVSNPSTVVHLHWVAIAGIISFMAQCLHLLPLDNTAGSKMTFAVLGVESYEVFSVLVGLVKFFFLGYVLISSFGTSGGMLLGTQILADFVLSSQIVGDTVS